MRGVLFVIMTILILSFGMLLGVTMVEPFGQIVEDENAGEAIGQEGIVQQYYDSIFIGAPLVMMAGAIVWALFWYVRDERVIRR